MCISFPELPNQSLIGLERIHVGHSWLPNELIALRQGEGSATVYFLAPNRDSFRASGRVAAAPRAGATPQARKPARPPPARPVGVGHWRALGLAVD
jgi:hypothetical protein